MACNNGTPHDMLGLTLSRSRSDERTAQLSLNMGQNPNQAPGEAIVALDTADCATGGEQLSQDEYRSLNQDTSNYWPFPNQPVDFFSYGDSAGPCPFVGHFRDASLVDSNFWWFHGGQTATESWWNSITDGGASVTKTDTTALTVPSTGICGLGISVPVHFEAHTSRNMGSTSSMTHFPQALNQVQQFPASTFIPYHGQPNDEPPVPVSSANQAVSDRLQEQLREDYHNPALYLPSMKDMTGEFQAIPERNEPRERQPPVDLACVLCERQKKKCSEEFPCVRCSEKNKRGPKRRSPPRSQWKENIDSDLDDLIASNLGILGFDGYLRSFSDLSQWDDVNTISRFFVEYDGGRKLSHKRMIAYVQLKSHTNKSDKALSDDFVIKALRTPFARGLIAYANEICQDFGGTVAEWCKERLQIAKQIFHTHSTDPLSNDDVVKELCHVLQIISWSRHSTRDCKYMALCDRAYWGVLHGIAKMAHMPCSKAHVEMLGDKLEEQMDLFISRRKSRIFTELANLGHSPAKELEKMIQEVTQSVSDE